MDAVNKIWGIVQSIWGTLDGNKTKYGLTLGGIVLGVMNFENTFNIHPDFLVAPLKFLATTSSWLTGAGLGHKALKKLSPK